MFMVRTIAYGLQEMAVGGLKPSVLRVLDRVCDTIGQTSQKAIRDTGKCRTLLIREWRGVSIGSPCSTTTSSIVAVATSHFRK